MQSHCTLSSLCRATDIAPTPHQSPRGPPPASPSVASPAGSERSADSRFARALAVPARRLVEALQQRWSPRLATLAGSAGDPAAGSSNQRQRRQGQQQQQADALATAESGLAEPLLPGLAQGASTASDLPGPGLHHCLSAPTNMTRHLQQAAWEDEQQTAGARGGTPRTDVEQP